MTPDVWPLPQAGQAGTGLAIALASCHEQSAVLRVVDIQEHGSAEHGLRLGALTAFEQRRT
jgi:hypothetical protein